MEEEDGTFHFGEDGDGGGFDRSLTFDEARDTFCRFLKNYVEDQHPVYLDQIQENVANGEFYVQFDMANLRDQGAHSDQKTAELAALLRARPLTYLPACEAGAKMAALELQKIVEHEDWRVALLDDFQLRPFTSERPIRMRDLDPSDIEKLIVVSGIVVQTSRLQKKAEVLTLQCKSCGAKRRLHLKADQMEAPIPRTCDATTGQHLSAEERCPLDPYVICSDQCSFRDTQWIKLQELPEEVPAGELPRSIRLFATRYSTERLFPGARVSVLGQLAASEKANDRAGGDVVTKRVRGCYVVVVGFEMLEKAFGDFTQGLSNTPPEAVERFKEIAAQRDCRRQLYQSIAPAIFGLDNVKRAVCCLLFGGNSKLMSDGNTTRGDINVLLLGDPGCAKSQFLKFCEKAAPIAVFTSGKGSSAAGLTAAIVKDPSGGFGLEGGAMVLADGGVVCIDELDKMRPEDRVAIHEAMEQQTISIAKAGITTMLNTRCAVLAAANPLFGTYDDTKEQGDQIDLQATILSRFDLIFLIRDVRDPARDEKLARHIVSLHSTGAGEKSADGEAEAPLSMDQLKQYIAYAKSHYNPRLDPEAAQMLEDAYVGIRRDMKKAATGQGPATIPITVRQLEAITRITESLATMRLRNYADKDDVAEALELFRTATLEAAKSNLNLESCLPEDMKEIQLIEEALLRRLALGSEADKNVLVVDICKRMDVKDSNVRRAIAALIKQGEFIDRPNFRVKRVARGGR